MKWNDLTLWQYQQIMPILQNPDKDWTELDKEVKLLTIVTGLTEHQIDSLGIKDLKELRKDLEFLDEPIEGKPVNYIKANGKHYRINYDVKNMPFARYIESKVFSKDTVANLHKIAASIGFGAVAFMRIYGWHYTVKLIADHENIRNSEAFEMKTIEALNVMAYLKSKNAYDLEQTKRLR